MCSTNASSTSNVAKTGAKIVNNAASNVAGFVGFIVSVGAAYAVYTQTPLHLDWTLWTIVMEEYVPEVAPAEYISRVQEKDLRERLEKNIAGKGKFFMLMGESGSGKTTMMQHILTDYEKGVIFVKINTNELLKAGQADPGEVLKAVVLEKFKGCANHPRRHPSFTDFIRHANKVRLKEVKKPGGKEKDHPLILYITLDSKDDKLSYQKMTDIAKSFSVLAGDLSSENCCRTILEFSKTAISDKIIDIRGGWDSFQVDAMTEDEFKKIGKQVLDVKDDPQTLVEELLTYYHDWLGGHTKALSVLASLTATEQSMHSCFCYLFCTIVIHHTSHRSCVCHPRNNG